MGRKMHHGENPGFLKEREYGLVRILNDGCQDLLPADFVLSSCQESIALAKSDQKDDVRMATCSCSS